MQLHFYITYKPVPSSYHTQTHTHQIKLTYIFQKQNQKEKRVYSLSEGRIIKLLRSDPRRLHKV